MKITDFINYREYLKLRVKFLPDKGRGELGRIATHLNIQSSMLSQILHGTKNLSLEHACSIAKYFKMTTYETDYFLLLVQYERASSDDLKSVFKKQISNLKNRAPSPPQQDSGIYVIPDDQKSQFYSSWYYSGIRLLTAIPGFNDIDSIAQRFDLPKDLVQQTVEFLVQNQLCTLENGKIKVGHLRTHLDTSSTVRSRHHMNWRIKGLDRIPRASPSEFFFSFPMCLSEKDSSVVRAMIMDLIEKIDRLVKPSESEKLSCLNIDWFNF